MPLVDFSTEHQFVVLVNCERVFLMHLSRIFIDYNARSHCPVQKTKTLVRIHYRRRRIEKGFDGGARRTNLIAIIVCTYSFTSVIPDTAIKQRVTVLAETVSTILIISLTP